MADNCKGRLCLGKRWSPVYMMFHVTGSTQHRPWTWVATLFIIVCMYNWESGTSAQCRYNMFSS